MTPQYSDAALADLKDRNPCHVVAGRWVTLRKKGKGFVGPCPICSRDSGKKSATKFEIKDDRWVCAVCMKGGDVIQLVREVEGKSFTEAVDSLGGAFEPDPAEKEKRERVRKDKREKADRENARYREAARETAFEIWKRGVDPAGTPVEAYLYDRRYLAGLPLDKMRLRFSEAQPYWSDGTKGSECIHRGPAMLAPIVRAGKFSAVHITWLDLDQAKGKVVLLDAAGAVRQAKRVRGPKKGGHIELVPALGSPRRLILGEGIEKVGAVWCAFAREGQSVFDTAFWTASDLGNIGGKSIESVPHPTLKDAAGRTRKVSGFEPDMTDPLIEIPDSVTELVLLGDTTSDRFITGAALVRAQVRFAKEGRTVTVAWPPEGEDFDDTLRRPGGAGIVCAAIDAAEPLTPANVMAAALAGVSPPQARQNQPGDAEGGAPIDLPLPSPGAAAADPPGGGPLFDDIPLPDPPAGAGGGFSADDEKGQPSRIRRPGARSANRARWSGPPRKGGDDDDDTLDRWLAKFPLTELGLIERYVQRWRGKLLFCPSMGWFAWDGRRWMRDGAEGRAIAAGHDTVRAIQDEAEAMRGTPEDVIGVREVSSGRGKDKVTEEVQILLSDLLAEFGRDSETKSKMSLHKDAAPYLSVEVDQLDADPFAINIMNGTLIVRRTADEPLPARWQRVGRHIRLKPHDPADRITKLMPVAFDAKAACPEYDAFLEHVQPDAAVRAFLDEWDGYSLTGDASEQKLVFHYGTGKNGKSTYFAVVMAMAGDYGKSIPIETFVNEGKARSAGQASPDLAMLRRVRNLVTSEPERGWKLNEALIKSLTGGDEVPVRELHRPYFMLKPEFKLRIGGNHKPNLGGGEAESGMWRRIVLLNWLIRISKDKQDAHLADKLKAELSGILNRWLRGLTRWLQRGLLLPQQAIDATEQFRVDSDPLGRWLDECTEHDQNDAAQTTLAFDLFKAWCRANGEREWTQTGFGRAMGDRGFIKRKNSVWYWLGIKLVKQVGDFLDHQGNPLTGVAKAEKPGGPSRNTAREDGSDDDDIPF